MEVDVRFFDGPIPDPGVAEMDGAGATVTFQGVVRGSEDGRPISALIYEHYPAMAERVIREILAELDGVGPCLGAWIYHRVGTIPVGETAILVRIDARHRGEAFRMLEEFMNRLKRDVPIWKVGVVSC